MELLVGLLFAAIVGVVHFGAHRVYGSEDSFDDAGVCPAGAAVVLVAFLLGPFVGSPR